ncbi:MAG: class I SAM-dependent methyltransferase, partial [Bacteroidota bacterium]
MIEVNLDMSPSAILNFYQNIHAGFLHANGEKGTAFLMDQLQLKGEERVLEIGFGTGASLVKFKSRFPGIDLMGLEASWEMMERARKRLAFCGLGGAVQLSHISEAKEWGAAQFDLVYIESVLAILNKTDLEASLQMIWRLLKPGALLALNESIWLKDISLEEIQRINRYCEEVFGIIQCNEVFRNRDAAVNWLQDQGFSLQFDQR